MFATNLFSPASTTTEFSYENVTLQEASALVRADEEQDEEPLHLLEKQVDELTMSSNKKKAIARNPAVWKAGFPYMITTWRDAKDRELVTVECHLPSGSIPEDVDMKLLVRGGKQFLALHYRISDVFLSQDQFDEMIGQFNFVEGKDASALSLARSSTVLNLRKTFTDKNDLDKRFVHMHKEIELPMKCEDIFDNQNYQGNYPNCSQLFRTIPSEDENGDPTDVIVLIVTLVGMKVEELEVTKRNTANRTLTDQHMLRVRRGFNY